MDLELSDEQTWLAESVETLLARDWVGPAPPRRRARGRARDGCGSASSTSARSPSAATTGSARSSSA